MKKFRKLIPAFVLLLISTAIMSSATFAWFSMNTQVTATGMQVTAKSDQIFLMINEGHVASSSTIQATKDTSATATNSSAVLLPAAHRLGSSATITTLDGTTVTSSGTVLTNWYWQTSADPEVATASSGELTIAVDKKGEYVLVNEFSITVAEGSNDVSGLKVLSCTITSTDAQAVSVIVATDEASEEFSGVGGAGSVVLRSTNLSDSDVQFVKIYIYWNGDDSDVYTNNIDHLLNTTVEVVFTGDPVPAA